VQCLIKYINNNIFYGVIFMKKTIAAVLALAAVFSLSACKNKTAVAGTSVTTAPTEKTATYTTPVTTVSATEKTEITEETTTETTVSEEEARDVNVIADAIQNAVKFPVMVEVTDIDRINDYFLVNPDDFDETLVLQSVLSSNMTEMIIIKTPDTSAAVVALTNRRDKAEKEDAFYPADLEKAKNAIIGSYKEYAYYIMSENAEDAEKALKTAVDGLEK
jgi:hypothetical protein